MIRAKPINTESKKFKAALARHVAAIVAVIERYNPKVEEDGIYRYVLNTPAGLLRIHVSGTSIFQRFDDVEAGRLVTQHVGHTCNPYSGKWNFGETNSTILDDPEGAMEWWKGCIESLMSIPYGWQPFADRLQQWLDNNKRPNADKLLDEVRTRVSDLGSMMADAAKSEDRFTKMLYSRLWAIREIVIGD